MKATFKNSDQEILCELNRNGDDFELKVLSEFLKGRIIDWAPPFFKIEMNQAWIQGSFYRLKDAVDIHLPQGNFRLRLAVRKAGPAKAHSAPGELTAPMPGKVLKVLVTPGHQVKKGDPLMILEAMKMEHQIKSPIDGEVKKILFKEGERVAQDEELVEIA